MLHLVLYEPEIPPNTGNIIRLCANTGCQLHLIEPMGFVLDDKRLRRAGLDYREWANARIHRDFASFLATQKPQRMFAMTTKGQRYYHQVAYAQEDYLVFGPESRGLPQAVREQFLPDHWLRVPMQPQSRSLNLSNTAALVVYEAWRQWNFEGGI